MTAIATRIAALDRSALGSGAPLTVRTLRAGDHTIKAMVTDNAGAKAAAARTIRVRTR